MASKVKSACVFAILCFSLLHYDGIKEQLKTV